VGYTGGAKQNPTYYKLGDHTETVQIDYDPEKISYERLLDIFWNNHDPTVKSWSKQYRPVIVYHNDEQKKLALKTKAELEERLRTKISTEIIPAGRFYLAEDYHQKYYLRQTRDVVNILRGVYNSDASLVESTAAARLNGCIYNGKNCPNLKNELKASGLPPETIQKLLDVLK